MFINIDLSLLLSLIKNDLKSQYLGSYLGIIWAFIQPLAFITILWFVFEVGFKIKSSDNFPFVLWLISGLIPWFFILNSISSSTNSISTNTFLVKKVSFRVSLLPIVKISSSLVIHTFFIFILLLIFSLYGYSPTIYWVQIPIYLFITIVLLTGISLLTSSLVIFFKDISQAVPIFLQFFFWATPIFWNSNNVPKKYMFLVDYNPFNFIIQGYRDSLIYNRWFFEESQLLLFHGTLSVALLAVGIFTFRKLRPHFPDVL